MAAQITSPQVKWIWLPYAQLSVAQLDEIFQLRQAVFVVEQNCPYQDADGKDSKAIHLLGYQDNQLVAYLRYFPSYPDYDGQSSLGRVCTHTKVRGSGIGLALMQQALNYADTLYGDKRIVISAQAYLEGFYQSLGFVACSDIYLEDDIPHLQMQRIAKA